MQKAQVLPSPIRVKLWGVAATQHLRSLSALILYDLQNTMKAALRRLLHRAANWFGAAKVGRIFRTCKYFYKKFNGLCCTTYFAAAQPPK